jgi:RHH-type proline utilization regulon transcriptional repressor/proline dehydrogenase/delta 1-pyrroline-5-carboxylate dehydrogenase
VPPKALVTLPHLGGVMWWGDIETGRSYDQALAKRDGPITALITTYPDAANVLHERHVCIDTTAAGGNAALLAEVGNI